MAAVDYKVIKNFFSKEELKFYQKYCFNQLDYTEDINIDVQSFSPAWRGDPLMNALLDTKLPLVEKESNFKLIPSYAYWRYYVFGATLKKHRDKPTCEISVTACIKKYNDWPLIIEGETIELKEGEALLYAGYDRWHGRPGTYRGEGMAQVFLHYVQ